MHFAENTPRNEEEMGMMCMGMIPYPSAADCWNSIHHSIQKQTEKRVGSKLQALAYDILPSTTAIFSYATGFRKLSANEQFFIGAQTVVSLLQTTEIKQGVSFVAANKVYTSSNKTTIIWIETELFSLPRVDVSHVYVGACVQ